MTFKDVVKHTVETVLKRPLTDEQAQRLIEDLTDLFTSEGYGWCRDCSGAKYRT